MTNPVSGFGTATPSRSEPDASPSLSQRVNLADYPALFRRPAFNSQNLVSNHGTIDLNRHERLPTSESGHKILEAVLGYCQALFLSATGVAKRHHASENFAANHARSAARRFGFTDKQMYALGFGVYSSGAAVREYLNDVGFTDNELANSRITRDEFSRPRAELTGNLVIPIRDTAGTLIDLQFVSIDARQGNFSATRYLSGIALQSLPALCTTSVVSSNPSAHDLVLVENVLDALFLQQQGLHSVAAIGGLGNAITPQRWEALGRLGLRSVTLAFGGNDHTTSIRDALVHALRSRVAPQVWVYSPRNTDDAFLASTVKRDGCAAFENIHHSRTLAFHQKDFGFPETASRQESRVPTPVQLPEPHFREAFRQHISELISVLPEELQPRYQDHVVRMEQAIRTQDWSAAEGLLRKHDVFSRMPAPSAAVNSSHWLNGSAALDRLTFGSTPHAEPRLRFDGLSPHGPFIENVIHHSADVRLRELSDRILDACVRDADSRLLIICREHTSEDLLFNLMARWAARLDGERTISVEQVRHRVRSIGTEMTRVHANASQWVLDEAIRRVKLWSNRFEFWQFTPSDLQNTSWNPNGQAGTFSGVFIDSDNRTDVSERQIAHDNELVQKSLSRWASPVTIASRYGVAHNDEGFSHLPESEQEFQEIYDAWLARRNEKFARHSSEADTVWSEWSAPRTP